MKIISIRSIHGTFIGFITKKMQHGYMKKKTTTTTKQKETC